MSRYLTEMGQYDLIGYEEMQLLFKSLGQAVDLLKSLDSTSEVSADDQQVLIDGAIAHRTIYLSNLRLVVHVAKQFPARGTMTFQDMVQEGNIGLTRAIARFDVDRGNTFSTYAINWIRQSIMRGIANQARMIRIPAHRHEQFRKLLDIKAELGDNPTIEELSEAMRLKESDILLLLSFGPDNIASLDEPLSYGDITYSHTVTHDRLTDPPESEVDQIGNRDLINKMLADPKLNLTDQEKIVLSLRYSIYIEAFEGVVIDIPHHGKLSYGDIMSRFSLAEGIILDDLGGLIGLSRERVRQIEHKAFNKIRGKYHNRDIRVTDNN
jgi:RNA polymerase primary sigma factor